MRAHDARPHGLDVVGAVDVAVTLERGDGGENAFRGRGFLGRVDVGSGAREKCQGRDGGHPCQMFHRVILLFSGESSETAGNSASPQPARRGFCCKGLPRQLICREESPGRLAGGSRTSDYGPSAPTGTTLTPFSIRYPPPPGTITHSAEGSL